METSPLKMAGLGRWIGGWGWVSGTWDGKGGGSLGQEYAELHARTD